MAFIRNLRCLAILALAGVAGLAQAEVRMPAIFGSNMVLQRETKVPLWGTADAGEKITVSFAGQTAEATAGSDGKWQATLSPLAPSAEGRTLMVKGKNALQFDNVLVGDVWICSGQSNMEWTPTSSYMGFSGIVNQQQEIAAANHPQLRLIEVKKATSTEPLSDIKGSWAACTPEVMQKFSAIGYFFGREVSQKIKVPVGLIGTYWGGTPAQSWTRQAALESDPVTKQYLAKWAAYTAGFEKTRAQYPVQLAAWRKAAAAAKAAGKRAPNAPRLEDPVKSQLRPANLYNAMIAPLVPFAIKGVIWYQGESNAGTVDAPIYQKLLSMMISDWRAQWGQGDFPFLIAQLANFQKREDQPGESSWARLRESQLKTLALNNTGMAVLIDAGEAENVHPRDKQTPGHRLALAALKVAYGQDLVYSGPVYESLKVEGGKAILSFKHIGGGLLSKAEGEKVKGFAIAGADKKFVWADAKIAGDTVVVSSPAVKAPAAVRYGWANNPEVSLYNKEGLPATPFRTDNWEPQTVPYPAPKGKQARTGRPARKARQAKAKPAVNTAGQVR